MMPPDDMDKKVEEYTSYLALGVFALLFIIVLMLVFHFLVGLVTLILGG